MAHFPTPRFVRAFPPGFLVLAALVAAIALPGCSKGVSDPNDPKFIVAEKAPWSITREELNKEVATFLSQHQVTAEQVGPAKMPIIETVALKNLVLKKLLLDKAATEPSDGLDKEEAAQFQLIQGRVPPGQDLATLLKPSGLTVDDLKKEIHEKVLVENVLKNEAFKNVEPTEQEIDTIYLANKDKFTIPPKIRASRILVHVDIAATPAEKAAKKKIIDQAHARVVKGEDFGKVAAEMSEDQSSKTRGGDLGYFARGENPDTGFDDVAFNTKENTVSPVFLTPLGYQFVKVTAIQPAGVVPVADARNYISQRLRDQKMQEAAQTYAKQLLADSGVTYHLVLVDPPAQVPDAGTPGPDGSPGPPPDASGPPPGPGAPAPDAHAPAPPPPSDASAPAPAPNTPPSQ